MLFTEVVNDCCYMCCHLLVFVDMRFLTFHVMQVVTDVLHLHGEKITTYKGDYDTFERTRDERLRNQQKAHEANERTRSHIQVGSSPSNMGQGSLSAREANDFLTVTTSV